MSGKNKAGRFRWLWNRLRCMSFPELGYRVCQMIMTWSDRAGLTVVRYVPEEDAFPQFSDPFEINKSKIDVDAYVRMADRIIAGEWDIFALQPAHLGCFPQWDKDPLTERQAPLEFGQTMPITNKAKVGDIKYLWEQNRHLQLVKLAQAYYLTDEERFLKAIKLQIQSWLAQSPYPLGINWVSSLEMAIRLINWSWIWNLIGGSESKLFAERDGQDFLRQWLGSIYRHCHFIYHHLSLHSSANNHLIGELSGLYIASNTWPVWKQLKKWGAKAKEALSTEILKQNTEDGVNKEHAIAYQQFVLDFFLLSGLSARRVGDDFSPSYWVRIERMLEFVASIMDRSGNVPMFGDADDGFVVNLHTDHAFSSYRSLLATGAVLFNRGDFKIKATHFDEKSFWLLSNAGYIHFESMGEDYSPLPIKMDFKEGGYHIIGSDFGTDKEILAIIDYAPLGYLGIAAHGHADALSLVLSVGGKEILVDPGTYAYHADQCWRDYFRGTSAHNTVRIDHADQSVSGGRFMWLHKAQARCDYIERDENTTVLIGAHNGYCRLSDPVTHQRALKFDKNKRCIIVTDTFICKETHTIEIFWHFSELCVVERVENNVIVQCADVKIELFMPNVNWQPVIKKGDEKPIAGWVSRSYDIKVPSFTVFWEGKITGETALETIISISG